MVRKRTLQNTDNGKTSSRSKKHKSTEKELVKADNQSSILNGYDVSTITRKSKSKLQNKQTTSKEIKPKEESQNKDAVTTDQKKSTNKSTRSKQSKAKESEENVPKKRKASTCSKAKAKKQKSEYDICSDDNYDNVSKEMPQSINQQSKTNQSDTKLNITKKTKTGTRKSKINKQTMLKTQQSNAGDPSHDDDNDLRQTPKTHSNTTSISKKSFDGTIDKSPQKQLKSPVKSPRKLVASKASPIKAKSPAHLSNKNDANEDSRHGNISDDSGDESDDDVDWEDVQEVDGNHGNSDVISVASSSVTNKSEDKEKSVEISIEIPGMRGKKRKKQEDLKTKIQKAMAKFQKQIQLNKHKVHLLMLVSLGFHRNAICNQPSIQAWCLSCVPHQFTHKPSTKWQIDDLIAFLSWFKEKFTSLQKISFEMLKNGVVAANHLPKHLAEVLVAVLRSLGLLVRLVFSLQPVPMKIESKTSKKNTKSPQSSKKSIKVVASPAEEAAKHGNATSPYFSDDGVRTPVEKKKGRQKDQENASTPKTSKNADTKNKSNKSLTGKLQSSKEEPARKLRKKKKVNYVVNDTENDDNDDDDSSNESDYTEETLTSSNDIDDDDIFEETKFYNVKTPKAPQGHKTPKMRNTPKVNSIGSKSKSPLVVDLLDDDDDFEVSSKPLIKKKPSTTPRAQKRVKILSSDEDSSGNDSSSSVSKGVGSVADFWVEVYLSSKKTWSCIDMKTYSIDQPHLCEEHAHQPVTYVLGYDNDDKVKDVTGRYASEWLSKTKKMRIDNNWWEETLFPFKTKKKKMDEAEDALLLEQHQERPMPPSINEYKNHPLYVLKRHLLKFEAIYPETAATLGFIRGEAIYSRDCVHLLHTREKWMSLDARVVKQGEQPYKIVKGRVKRNQPVVDPNSVTIDLFGRWQTEDYKPPPAKDGIVPRNEYGNVELFKPSMLPPGTKHIQIPGIQKIAKKLGIDGAPAVVGFDFHCGFCHPIIDGLVVCKESVPTLMDAWRQEQQEAQRRKEEKREKKVLGNWKLIVKSLLIRERLKRKYNTHDSQEPTTSTKIKGEVLEDEKVTTEAIAWPQNMKEGKTSVADEGHVHIFPKKLHKKDKITGEWSKVCSCGYTLPLDK